MSDNKFLAVFVVTFGIITICALVLSMIDQQHKRAVIQSLTNCPCAQQIIKETL